MDSQKTEVGYVLSIRDYLIFLDGLPTVRVNDLVENDAHIRGVISALAPDKAEVWILDEGSVTPGQLFKKTDKRLGITAGDFLLGRAVNPLGIPIDGKGPLSKTRGVELELQQNAPPMQTRQFITDQFITGITLIDTLIPLGKGQRELVLGDTHAGKTPFLIDLINNQAKLGTVCIYTAVGKPVTAIRNMIDVLGETGALKNTVIVAATSSDASPLIFYTPYSGMTIAEYFQKQGKDVLVIFDDLGTHAKVYRELALLGGRPPGRQSYPGDIFYTHARLLERAGKFNGTNGGGSITAIPMMELNLTDFTGFIPTNLMAMTDGHFIFSSELFAQGFRPAINTETSISRVGRQTQNRLQNLLSQAIRQILAEASGLETLSRFSGELPEQTQITLKRKDMLTEICKQEPLTYIPPEIQIVFLGLPFTSLLRDRNVYFLQKNKLKILNFLLKEPEVKPFAKSLLALRGLNQLMAKLELLAPKLKEICR
ncbi:MAG: F-type H+-transporting ATPase subunit alpha [Microgenomates group bacterium Gr01-1014_80]|nr:MAG: F-type H+-transporting ATPase subunit alpha [Microgenomates group bacterium Gr01-1014_80]